MKTSRQDYSDTAFTCFAIQKLSASTSWPNSSRRKPSRSNWTKSQSTSIARKMAISPKATSSNAVSSLENPSVLRKGKRRSCRSCLMRLPPSTTSSRVTQILISWSISTSYLTTSTRRVSKGRTTSSPMMSLRSSRCNQRTISCTKIVAKLAVASI